MNRITQIKKMHGYLHTKLINNNEIDQKLSCLRTKNRSVTSHFEAYLSAIQDQEVPTKFLKHKRQRVLHHHGTTSAD